MKGRKPKPIEFHIINGNPSRLKLPKNTKKYAGNTTPPGHLGRIGLNEWKRIIPELKRLGMLSKLDRAAIAAYCQTYERWVEAEKVIAEKGVLYKSPKGNIQTSPMLWVANKALEQMYKYLTEFGMTPASRTRMQLKESEPKKEPMSGILEKRKNAI